MIDADQILIDQAKAAFAELSAQESFDDLNSTYLRLRSFLTIVTLPEADCNPETVAFMKEIDRKAYELWLERGTSPSSTIN